MITAGQIRAARALLGIDRRGLAALAALSVPTIQRVEASDGVIRGNFDSLGKRVAPFDTAGIAWIADCASRTGGRGVRLRIPASAAPPETPPDGQFPSMTDGGRRPRTG